MSKDNSINETSEVFKNGTISTPSKGDATHDTMLTRLKRSAALTPSVTTTSANRTLAIPSITRMQEWLQLLGQPSEQANTLRLTHKKNGDYILKEHAKPLLKITPLPPSGLKMTLVISNRNSPESNAQIILAAILAAHNIKKKNELTLAARNIIIGLDGVPPDLQRAVQAAAAGAGIPPENIRTLTKKEFSSEVVLDKGAQVRSADKEVRNDLAETKAEYKRDEVAAEYTEELKNSFHPSPLLTKPR